MKYCRDCSIRVGGVNVYYESGPVSSTYWDYDDLLSWYPLHIIDNNMIIIFSMNYNYMSYYVRIE